MQEVLNFLKENPTFFIATNDGDQPRVRPFGAFMEMDGKLYLVTGNPKDVYKQMKANPKVEICGMNAKSDWMRIAAEVVFDTRKETQEKMLAENANLAGLYTVGDGIMEVFYLKNATATFCSFTDEPKVVKF